MKYILVVLLPCICLAQTVVSGHRRVVKSLGGGGGTWSTKTATCVATGGGSQTSATCTWSANPVSGDSIFCAAALATAGATISVTDSNSDTFTSVGAQVTPFDNSLGLTNVQLFWFPNLTTTITSTTLNTTGVSSSIFPNLTCNVATDSGNIPTLDGTQCYTRTFTTTTVSCASSLTLAGTDYVFAYYGGSAGTLTPGTGFTAGTASGNNTVNEYGLFTSSATPSGNSSTSTNMSIVGAAFKP